MVHPRRQHLQAVALAQRGLADKQNWLIESDADRSRFHEIDEARCVDRSQIDFARDCWVIGSRNNGKGDFSYLKMAVGLLHFINRTPSLPMDLYEWLS
jgi:hypothetical protein